MSHDPVQLSLRIMQVLVKVGAVKAVTSLLDSICIQYEIYDGVEPNPTIEQVTSFQLHTERTSCCAAVAVSHCVLIFIFSLQTSIDNNAAVLEFAHDICITA